MGYRSEVAYVIKFNDIAQRDAFVTLMLAKNDPIVTEAINDTTHEQTDDPVITFRAGDVKWYASFPDVQVHHQMIREATELYEAEWRFVRIGEDSNDIEVQEEGNEFELWEYVDPVSSIRTSF
jgi:hypothetical protein